MLKYVIIIDIKLRNSNYEIRSARVEMKTKVTTLFLTILLIFTMAACSGGDESAYSGEDGSGSEASGEVSVENGETQGEEGSEDVATGDEASEDEEAADFGISIKKSFEMSGTLDKISYKDISELGETLEGKLTSALKKASMENFVIAFSDYEEYGDEEADGIDRITYAIAVEDDDTDKATVEIGVYHNTKNDKYYQYSGYTSETLANSTAPVKMILSDIESAYGIKMSEKKIEAALKTAWEKAEKRQDFYSLYQTKAYKGDGYTDRITVRVDVGYDEDDNMGAYIYAERERLYT